MKKYGRSGESFMGKKIDFLPEQKKAIELRNRNILVSASAGAGKTAVLTERIIDILLNKENPVDIDKMVVVTFTRAAAAEMRTRIAGKLNDRLSDCRDALMKKHIRKQIALLAHASITTIDSFCMNILHNYFYMIGIDPAFKVADENDIKLMKKEVLDRILCERYEKRSPEFIDMIERLSPGKTDDAVCETIMQLYRFSVSHPWPLEWLDSCEESFEISDDCDIDSLGWIKESGMLKHIKCTVSEESRRLEKAFTLCEPMSGDGSDSKIQKLYQFFKEEYENVNVINNAVEFSDYYREFSRLEFLRLPSLRNLSDDEQYRKDMAKNLRDTAKKNLMKIKEEYFSDDEASVIKDLKTISVAMKEIIAVTKEFYLRFNEKKREENVVDFNDVEHFALEILLQKGEDGKYHKTNAAKELKEQYEYILIDEYQDSNDVQETILTAISREDEGNNNLFMVGDVKQSIYQFRLAKPDIFEKKRTTYTDDDSPCQRIILGRNFRSSRTILEAVNYLFANIMKKDIGGVDYDETHNFKFGDNNNITKETSNPVEVIYVTKKEEAQESDVRLSDYSKQEAEALAVAKRIEEITCSSDVKYSDIVILLRSLAGWAEKFVEVLTSKGIPVVAEERTGYFSAYEIQTVLSFLKIIDNPKQDIPLAAVMKSAFGEFTDSELARIRMTGDLDMYSSLCMYVLNNPEDELTVKSRAFLDMLNDIRKRAPYRKVYETIEEILKLKDFALRMEAMPAGDRRSGNLRMLVDKAIGYEADGKKSVFEFIRAIEEMIKADIDFGEASMDNSGAGVVRIMSIHKSKGLEFPLVFVSGMGKGINLQDSRKAVIVHSELGLGPEIVDYKKRTRKKTLIRKAIAGKIADDVFGEELRVLYVAMTRPQNKLILTGYVDDAEAHFEESVNEGNSYSRMKSSKTCYLDWVTPSVLANDVLFEKRVVNLGEIIADEGKRKVSMITAQNKLADMVNETDSSDIRAMINDLSSYTYPYEAETRFAMKVSVSEIKHNHAYEEEETVRASWVQTERQQIVPEFIKSETNKDKTINGAGRGTIYHTIMEYLNLSEASDYEQVVKQINALSDKGIVPDNIVTEYIVSVKKILNFTKSEVALRMKKADLEGRLYREQPFVMGLPGKMVYRETDSEEIVIVQGIIDAFFEEEDGIVLLDYKTDRINEGEEDILVKRYSAQMECYKNAIKKATGKEVKETILYSFSLDKEIELKSIDNSL